MLAVVCSALAFLLMVALIGEIGPVKATAITYVNPAVAILAGVLVLGERVTVWTIAGFGLVLAGSYLVTRKRAQPVGASGVEDASAERPDELLADDRVPPRRRPEVGVRTPES